MATATKLFLNWMILAIQAEAVDFISSWHDSNVFVNCLLRHWMFSTIHAFVLHLGIFLSPGPTEMDIFPVQPNVAEPQLILFCPCRQFPNKSKVTCGAGNAHLFYMLETIICIIVVALSNFSFFHSRIQGTRPLLLRMSGLYFEIKFYISNFILPKLNCAAHKCWREKGHKKSTKRRSTTIWQPLCVCVCMARSYRSESATGRGLTCVFGAASFCPGCP